MKKSKKNAFNSNVFAIFMLIISQELLVEVQCQLSLIYSASSSQLVNMYYNNNLHFHESVINKIPENFTMTLDCNSESSEKIVNQRVLRYKSCQLHKILNEDQKLSQIIENSSYIFIISFEIDTKLKEITRKFYKFFKNLHRTVIINVYSNHDNKEVTFSIEKGHLIRLEFLSDLLTLTEYEEQLKYAMKTNCGLCLRILHALDSKNYEEKLSIRNDDTNLRCDIECFRALLVFPFDFDFAEVPEYLMKFLHENYIRELKKYTSKTVHINENYTKEELMEKYSKFRMNLDGISTLAWFQGQYKIFEFLIRADCFYPIDLDDHAISIQKQKPNRYIKKLEDHITKIENFHNAIKSGDVQQVKSFLMQHKNLKFLRDKTNKSALQVAFECEEFEIYSILKANGLLFSDLQELALHYEEVSELDDAKRDKIRQFNYRHLQSLGKNVSYIEKLIQKTKINISNVTIKEKLVEVVRKAYEDINEIASEILEISSNSDELEIIFDFEYAVGDEYVPGISAVGMTVREYNYVLVAASNLLSENEEERNYVLGTISHELTHFVMYLIYDNGALPYKNSDIEGKNLFRNITEDAKIKEDIEPFWAYDDDADEFHIELIARTPDILLNYKHNSTKIEILKNQYKELFDFYENRVLNDVRRLISTMNVREKIRDFNRWFDLVRKIDESFVEIEIGECEALDDENGSNESNESGEIEEFSSGDFENDIENYEGYESMDKLEIIGENIFKIEDAEYDETHSDENEIVPGMRMLTKREILNDQRNLAMNIKNQNRNIKVKYDKIEKPTVEIEKPKKKIELLNKIKKSRGECKESYFKIEQFTEKVDQENIIFEKFYKQTEQYNEERIQKNFENKQRVVDQYVLVDRKEILKNKFVEKFTKLKKIRQKFIKHKQLLPNLERLNNIRKILQLQNNQFQETLLENITMSLNITQSPYCQQTLKLNQNSDKKSPNVENPPSFHSLLNFTFQFDESKKKYKAIVTNYPLGIAQIILKKVRLDDILAIFMNLSSCDLENILTTLHAINNMNDKIYIIVNCDDISYLPLFIQTLNLFNLNQIIFIGIKFDEENFDTLIELFEIQEFNIYWRHLSAKSRKNFLDSKFYFQDDEVTLNDVIGEFKDEDLDFLPLNSIENGELNGVGFGSLESNEAYLIERKLIDESGRIKRLRDFVSDLWIIEDKKIDKDEENSGESKELLKKQIKILKKSFKTGKINNQEKSFSKINEICHEISQNSFKILKNKKTIKQSHNSSIFVISELAERGKSTALRQIALEIRKNSPSMWIVFMNMNYYEDFSFDLNEWTEMTLINFITKHALNFEFEMMKLFLKNRRVIFIFDEFCGSKFEMKFITESRKFSNQIWIATGVHHEKILKEKFRAKILKLKEFDRNDLHQYLEFFDENHEKNLIKIIENSSMSDLGIISSLAEAVESLNDSSNLYRIYSEVVLKKNFENSIVDNKDLSAALESPLDVLKTHQLMSLTFLYSKALTLSNEKKFSILKYKLISLEINNNIKFSEKNLAEFFAAQFFIDKLLKTEISEQQSKDWRLFNHAKKFSSWPIVKRFIKDFIALNEEKFYGIKLEKLRSAIGV